MNLIDHLKGRIAEALVESIFREHGYRVSRLGRESDVQRLMSVGKGEFLPDLLAWKARAKTLGLHQVLNIEVKYCANLGEYLRRFWPDDFDRARERWPYLYFVLVTDRPHAGLSCFQTVWLGNYVAGSVPMTTDLHAIREFGICRSTVAKHEAMARDLFATLRERMPPRRVVGKVVGVRLRA